jgi:acyl dehydratase
MTESFDPRQHHFPERRFFEDLAVGERFYIPSRTMTEAHFAAFQTLSGDNHPIHYDVEYCRERGHPGLLAHGFQILCFTAAGAGSFALGIGDAQRSTGVVTLAATVHNQRSELVLSGEQKILLRKRPNGISSVR